MLFRRDQRANDEAVAAATLVKFQNDLELVRRRAGRPSYDLLAHRVGYSKSTIARVFNGSKPPTWPVVETILQTCEVTTEVIDHWKERWAGIVNLFNPVPRSPQVSNDHAATHGIEQQAGEECTACGAWVTNRDRHAEWHTRFVPKLTAVPANDSRRKGTVQHKIG